jgi:hypothetical protein
METFSVPRDDVELAHFDLQLSTQKTMIRALSDSTNLIEAEIDYFGDLDFWVTGEEEKWITLQQGGIFSWPSIFLMEDDELTWDIGLSPEVLFDLEVDASTGESDLDLSGISLSNLKFNASTGASQIRLPGSSRAYEVYLEASTGGIDLVLPQEGPLTMRVNGSTGRIRMDIPEGIEVRIEVLNGGTGNLILPDWISKVSGAADRDEGVYASGGADSEDPQLSIIIEDLSTGNIVIN